MALDLTASPSRGCILATLAYPAARRRLSTAYRYFDAVMIGQLHQPGDLTNIGQVAPFWGSGRVSTLGSGAFCGGFPVLRHTYPVVARRSWKIRRRKL
jgi:hypothetical protein